MLTFNALTNTNTITKSTMDGIINMSSGFAGLDVGSDIQLSSSIQTILNGNSLTKSTMGITMSCDYAGLHITSSLQLSSDAGLGVLSTNTTNLNTYGKTNQLTINCHTLTGSNHAEQTLSDEAHNYHLSIVPNMRTITGIRAVSPIVRLSPIKPSELKWGSGNCRDPEDYNPEDKSDPSWDVMLVQLKDHELFDIEAF